MTQALLTLLPQHHRRPYLAVWEIDFIGDSPFHGLNDSPAHGKDDVYQSEFSWSESVVFSTGASRVLL
jgi:hypothetical protein